MSTQQNIDDMRADLIKRFEASAKAEMERRQHDRCPTCGQPMRDRDSLRKVMEPLD